jgi:HK97 family phage portal protein
MGILNSILSVFGSARHPEGQYREGPYHLPYSGGWLSAEAGRHINWWQMGYGLEEGGRSAIVEACVGAYAQTVAMCPGNHWSWSEAAGRTRVANSALTRLVRKPNSYQSISDFLLNLVRNLLDGEAFALALRNDRFEIVELHLMNPRESWGQVAENGEVFYSLGGNEIVERIGGKKRITVPARDVLHVRMHTPRHPLVGESPLAAAALQMAAGNAALQQQVLFYMNQARPSFVLTTDQVLKMEQVRELRALWNEQAAGLAKGGTPILTAGLKAQPISVSAVDAQLADLLKLSDQAISNVDRVPLQVLGIGSSPYSSTEALMQHWLASGLGFVLNHVEEAIGLLFKLKGQPDEYIEFDTSALQRVAFKDRVEAWAAGTKGGVFGRNEARRDFEMKPVDGGDEPWVQQQDIPLSVAAENAKNPPAPPQLPAPTPQPDDEEGEDDADKSLAEAITRHWETQSAA